MTKRLLKIKDIEKLENTSLPGVLAGEGLDAFGRSEDCSETCNVCLGPTSCCNPNATGDYVCVGPTACCGGDTVGCATVIMNN